MRKQRRLFYWLVALLSFAVLLLLLSALVETPTAPAPAVDRGPVAAAQALTALPLTFEGSGGWRGLFDMLRLFVFIAFATLPLPLLCTCRDQNGRVLRAGRYVKSFYPIFKQELACG
jgi:hypothetical protein